MKRKDYRIIISSLKQTSYKFIELYPDTPKDILINHILKYHKLLIDVLINNIKEDNPEFDRIKWDEEYNRD